MQVIIFLVGGGRGRGRVKVDVQAGESSSPRCAKNRALCKELFMLCDLTDRKKKSPENYTLDYLNGTELGRTL